MEVDKYAQASYEPTLGSSKEGECFLVQCMNHYELTKMVLELEQEYFEPNNYPAVIGAIEKRDGSACRPICMSENSFEFMQRSEWKDPTIISYARYIKIFEGVDLNQMELYETLGMKI